MKQLWGGYELGVFKELKEGQCGGSRESRRRWVREMYMTISRKVLKATERKKSEYYTKFNEKPLVGVKKGGDLIDPSQHSCRGLAFPPQRLPANDWAQPAIPAGAVSSTGLSLFWDSLLVWLSLPQSSPACWSFSYPGFPSFLPFTGIKTCIAVWDSSLLLLLLVLHSLHRCFHTQVSCTSNSILPSAEVGQLISMKQRRKEF